MATDKRKKSRVYRALRWAYQPIKQARHEFHLLRCNWSRARMIRNYIERNGFKGLQIGCGPQRLEGWLNTDAEPSATVDFTLDITSPLPFPDAALDAIYAEEVLEHICLEDGRSFLREAHRVLRPGGVFRLTTPNLTALCKAMLGQSSVPITFFEPYWLEGEFSPAIYFNAQLRSWGHQFIYSPDELEHEVRLAGFRSFAICPPHETRSKIESLSGLERRYGAESCPDMFSCTLIVEATA